WLPSRSGLKGTSYQSRTSARSGGSIDMLLLSDVVPGLYDAGRDLQPLLDHVSGDGHGQRLGVGGEGAEPKPVASGEPILLDPEPGLVELRGFHELLCL